MVTAAPPATGADVHRALVADLREKLATAALGGSERSRARHVERGKLLPRERVDRLVDPSSPVPRAVPARRPRPLRRRRPRRRDDHRRRAGLRPGVRDRRQRRHRQGRHLLPDDGQEAPPRAGGGPAEPAAVHLPRRLRRRLPPRAGRGLPRPRALRPHLLQPGHDVRPGHPADRRRARLVHRGRRVRARDERRGGDRPQPGHDLPRRPAAGEGGDRRGRHRRGAGRRRPALPRLRRHRPPRRRRRPRPAHRPRHRRHPRPARAPSVGRPADRSRRWPTPTSSTTSCPSTPARPTTSAR